ncbi:sensor histidine kinase [Nocardiopsis suaedae]|uniref:histidine kinase n=1 Tax=Nocardiopsis suaedae TaxID=3018444 RepID=A0ABT4THE5_9ACTN|nr:sensor histidine kinase [Nocardiopsis suaedae]MDA2804130.1 sensor histidine kinase [Nocardiopsis suaedae]
MFSRMGPFAGRGGLLALDALAGAGYAGYLAAAGVPVPAGAPAWALAVVVLGTALPMALRRAAPRASTAAVAVATPVGVATGLIGDPFLAAGFTLYALALDTPGPRRAPAVVVGTAAGGVLVVAVVAGVPQLGAAMAATGQAVAGAAVLAASWAAGHAVRERRAQAARAAEELAARVAAEERLRVARDVHDIVSHTLSMIGIKAGVARHLAGERPREAQEALEVIERASREALAEMRVVLGAVRAGEGSASAPPPGPARLGELVRRAGEAGIRVDLDSDGAEGLPEAVGASLYRIVSEAVANAVRHSGADRCTVRVRAEGDAVRFAVTDGGGGERAPGSGPGAPAPPGHGIIGMRERAKAHGGVLEAGPLPDGGFEVRGSLPLGREGDR